MGEFLGPGTVAAVGFLVIRHAGEPASAGQVVAGASVFVLLGAQAHAFTSSTAAIAGSVYLSILVAGAFVGAIHGRILLALVQGGSSDQNAV